MQLQSNNGSFSYNIWSNLMHYTSNMSSRPIQSGK